MIINKLLIMYIPQVLLILSLLVLRWQCVQKLQVHEWVMILLPGFGTVIAITGLWMLIEEIYTTRCFMHVYKNEKCVYCNTERGDFIYESRSN